MRNTCVNNIIILGRQGSGKTSIATELSKYGYIFNKNYTTRPKRSDNDDEYHFLSYDEFFNLVDNGTITKYKKYNTAKGVWYYGYSLRNINSVHNNVTILEPNVYFELIHDIPNRFTIFIDLPYDIRCLRLIVRGDQREEIERREKEDYQKFERLSKNYKDVCDLAIRQNRTVEDNVDRILNYIFAYNRGEIDYDYANSDKYKE